MMIRKMQTQDLKKVVEIENQCFSTPWSKESFADSLKIPDALFLVAIDSEELLGYCGIYLSLDEGEITNVAVKKEARKQGVAGELLTQLQELAVAKKVSRILLEVRISNDAAIGLYEKFGFSKIGVRKKFYKNPIEDAFLMDKIM